MSNQPNPPQPENVRKRKGLKMEFHAYNDHIWVSGTGDSGKTQLVKSALIPLFRASNLRIAIYDYNHNYHTTGLPVTSKPEYLIKYLSARHSMIYQSPTNTDEEFERFCKVVRQYQDIIVIFEELQEFCRSKQYMPPHLSAIIKTGRNWKRSYVAVTQRPQEVPTAVMANCKHRFYFTQDLDAPADRKWMQNAIGEDLLLKLAHGEKYSYVYKVRNGSAELRPPLELK